MTRLSISACDFAAVELLEEALGVSSALAQVLVRRGLADPSAASAFIAAGESHSPVEFRGIEQAVGLIGAHIRAGTPITVHGDYDCDGVCSTAILVRALRSLGANVDWYLPDRRADGYGLAAHTVERLASRGTRLLICADCAITAVEEVAAARAAGIDVVVSDHHAPRADGRLPDAPIVHPTVSGYPCVDLCATAVASKLAACLRAGAGVAPLSEEPDLELVALGTVADVVPLRGENRRLVREGLRAMAATHNPGLRALMAVARVEPARVDEQALGFRLAPRINAAGRLYRADLGLELLLCDDERRAGEIAAELHRANAERRHTETRILFEAEAQVAAQGERAAYVVAGEGWHPGVIGIVASRIAERHQRPCVVIAQPGEREPGVVATGSCRSIPGFDLLAGLNATRSHLVRHGGHRAAAGLQLEPASIEVFRAAFCEYAAGVLTPDDLVPAVRADAVVSGEDVGLELAEELAQLAPFGSGNPPVALLVPCCTFEDPVGFGGDSRSDHVRFTVRSGGARARAICFGGGAKLPAEAGVPVDAVFRLEVNEWRGAVEPRLLLRHAAPCEPASIELLAEQHSFLDGVRVQLTCALEYDVEQPLAALRVLRDRRGRGVAATITSLVAGGERVLVVAADALRREQHLRGRLGGFALCSHAALEAAPQLADGFGHLVLLDPPPDRAARTRLLHGSADQTVYLAWGEPELRFALHIYEQEYGLRASLTALFPVLRGLVSAEGGVLETALRGDTARPRSPALAGRMLRVLAELDLVDLDPERMTLTVRSGGRAELDGSAAFRAYQRRLEDGRAFLIDSQAKAA